MLKAVSYLVAFLVLCGAAVHAQQATTVNPEAVEFDSPLLDAVVTEYRVELFVAGADPLRDIAVTSATLGPEAQQIPGRLRVELKDLVQDVPNGRYIAVVKAVTADRTVRTLPSTPFELAREGTVGDRIAEQKLERRWTKIAFVIGGFLLLVPYVF